MIRITAYDKDWSEREGTSEREVLITTPISVLRVVESSGVLRVIPGAGTVLRDE